MKGFKELNYLLSILLHFFSLGVHSELSKGLSIELTQQMHLPSIYSHPYKRSPEELRAIKTEIERMLKVKIIQPSQSEWGSPCILVSKPPGKGKLQPPRFVVDYCRINSVTQGDGCPLPSISSVLDAVSQGRVFEKCDLVSGYWQISIRQSD